MAEFIEDELTVDEFCTKEGCYADNYIDGHCEKCLNCIKQYFENKAKEQVIQMTINHIYNIVIDTMNKLEDIDFINLDKRKYNQQQLNEAYRILDNLKDELIREDIKRRHK